MKKVLFPILALVLVMGLVAPMAAPAVANTEADPAIIPLYAGQDIDVGTVKVWNDDTTLYVKYETTGAWVMTETHLAVAEEVEDIPQTKTGNPIPGKFGNSTEHNPAVQAYTYEIPLGTWESCDIHDLVIAAHAEVVRPIDGCDEIVWQIGDVETDDCVGDLTNYANEFNWMKANATGSYVDPVGDCELGPGLNANEPAFTDPFIVGTTPVNEFPYNSNYGTGYATDFDVQWNGELLFGGVLNISWSPGASATEKKVVSEDGISPTTLTAAGSSQSGQGWFMDKYPLVEHAITVDPLADGDHTINLQHTQGDGTFWDWITLEKPCEQWESAWAGTSVGEMPFDGNNWATYFEYTVQPILVDTVSVPAIGGVVSSSINLETGKQYRLKATGTAFAGDTIDFDAKYSITNRITGDTWTDNVSGYESYGPDLLELKVDGGFVEWGDYNSGHVYNLCMPGTGSPVALEIYDIYYPNNTGSLTVEIYLIP